MNQSARRRVRHRVGLVAGTALFAIVGCGDPPTTISATAPGGSTPPTTLTRSSSVSPLTDTELREANALRILTVALAKSLGDQGLRQRLNADMQRLGVTHEL